MPLGSWFGSRWSKWDSAVKSLWSRTETVLPVQNIVPDMQAGGLIDRERSVSPAIAVILMAAVAIILSATIGALVLSSGDDGATDEPAPTISADIDRGNGTLTNDNMQINISHKGGDTVDVSNLKIITETQCFDDDLLKLSEKRGELNSLPLDNLNAILPKNVNGDDIFQFYGDAKAPLASSTNTEWTAGEKLGFELDDAKCSVPERALMRVDVIHKPSNSIIVQESFGKTGFTPAALQTSVSNPTAGETSTHTLVIDESYGTPGYGGDQVDDIVVDYDPNGNGVDADFNGIDGSDVTLRMTVTDKNSGPVRGPITLNSEVYGGTFNGPSATIDTFSSSQTDVAGPIELEFDGIKNPTTAGTYDVEITLKGDAGPKTFTETINIKD